MKHPNWVSVDIKLPEDNKQVLVCLTYSGSKDIAMMYRDMGFWHFVGSNSVYNGKYLTHWLDNLELP